jgi:hypothetical protein
MLLPIYPNRFQPAARLKGMEQKNQPQPAPPGETNEQRKIREEREEQERITAEREKYQKKQQGK